MADWVEPAPNDRHPETNRGPSITDDNNKNSDAIADLQEGLGDRDALLDGGADLVARLAADKAALDEALDEVKKGRAPRTGLRLPGVSGNSVSTPDHADLRITGAIDLRWFGQRDVWAAGAHGRLISKTRGTDRGYGMTISNGNGVQLRLSGDGSTESFVERSIASFGFTDGEYGGIRATWRPSDGRVQFFAADDPDDPDGTGWTQVGTNQTIALASIHPAAVDLHVGVWSDGTTQPWLGGVRRAQVFDGIDGTLVADLRCDAPVAPRYRDATGKVWAFNGSAWSWEVA